MTELLTRSLERFGVLSACEKRVVAATRFATRHVGSGQDLVREGDQPSQCQMLLEGFACSYKLLETGQRQIMAFYIPGDVCDLTHVLLGKMDHGIGTLTATKVAAIPHATILDWTKRHPGLGHSLWRATLADAAVSREWIVNVGRRTAYQRTAHLLCELVLRMRWAGLADGFACDLPITQVELADALGLTPVHVNRTLQWLRGDGLIEIGNGILKVRSWRELKQAGGFDPAYLHQPTAGE